MSHVNEQLLTALWLIVWCLRWLLYIASGKVTAGRCVTIWSHGNAIVCDGLWGLLGLLRIRLLGCNLLLLVLRIGLLRLRVGLLW